MAAFLLHLGATVICAHVPGQAQPTSTNPRVKVSGQPIVTQASTYAIAGCGLSASGGTPCATATWIKGALRVKAGSVPVLLQDSQSQCQPTLSPLQVVTTQIRVKGS